MGDAAHDLPAHDFQKSLQRMEKYEGMITAKLDARGMPREVIYLAMIESNFNPTARSRVKAVGMWQFMSATARQGNGPRSVRMD